MRRILQVGLGALGASIIGIAVMLVIVGPAATPGAAPVNATLDNETRFYAALFGFYGAALLWCVRDVERKGREVRFLALALFAGGLARGVSMLAVGAPHPFFIAMMLVELVIPPLIIAAQRRLEQVPGWNAGSRVDTGIETALGKSS